MSGEPSYPTVSINATPFPQYVPVVIDDVAIGDTMSQSNGESQRTNCALYALFAAFYTHCPSLISVISSHVPSPRVFGACPISSEESFLHQLGTTS